MVIDHQHYTENHNLFYLDIIAGIAIGYKFHLEVKAVFGYIENYYIPVDTVLDTSVLMGALGYSVAMYKYIDD